MLRDIHDGSGATKEDREGIPRNGGDMCKVWKMRVGMSVAHQRKGEELRGV